jgi:uncharacterized protein (DUF2267 family)
MQYDEFVGQVQHRGRMASSGDAVKAIHATLQTLSERLTSGEAKDLAAQLPQEIAFYLHKEPSPKDVERFTLQEFFERVSRREHVDLPKSIHHARAVIDVLCDAVSPGEINDVRGQLPAEFAPLFESGSTGELAKKG